MSGIKELRLIETAEELAPVVDALRQETSMGIDTEFIRETTFYPKVALIQVATDKAAWLVDPTTFTPETLKPLLDVLADEKILKIMHAAHSDQECFHTAYQMTIHPVLDSAVAAALLGMGDNLGLGRLLKDLLNINLPKGRARARWLARPLSPELLEYAEHDVLYLVRLGEILIERLKAKGRYEWALEESVVDAAVFDQTPEEMARKIAKSGQIDPNSYCVLVELLAWREGRARRSDLPRAWVADNETIIALSKVKPKSIEELKSFRGLKPKEVEKNGNFILEAVRKGIQAPNHSYPKVHRSPTKTDREEHIVDLILSYISFLGARYEIANRFLLSSQKAYPLWVRAAESPESWVTDGLISSNANALIGNELKALMDGKRGLAIRNGRVEILELP